MTNPEPAPPGDAIAEDRALTPTVPATPIPLASSGGSFSPRPGRLAPPPRDLLDGLDLDEELLRLIRAQARSA